MTRARDVANLIGSGNYSSTTFTATAGQTAFTISHTQGFIQVFMNGLLLDETVDYTSNGSAVTLTSGAAAGDEIEVVKYNTFSVGDAIPASGGTFSGAVTHSGNVTHNGNLGIGASPSIPLQVEKAGGGNFVASFQNTTSGTPYGVHVKDASSGSNGYPLLQVTNSAGSSTYFRVDSGTGYVTKPKTPAFYAYGISNTASLGGTSNSGEYLKVGGNGVPVNNGSHYNASNGTFTAPVAGLYYFAFSLLYDNSYNGNGSAALRKNGSDVGEYAYVQGDATDYLQASASAVVSCATNDAIRIYSYPSGWHVASESSFTGFLIG